MSLIVPVYKNAANIAPLLDALVSLRRQLESSLEVVFVVDGSPDDSYTRLALGLPATGLRAQLILLSRNFGSFAAIRAGLEAARGDRFAVMAADLQEPPSLVRDFDAALRSGEVDVAIGTRVGRRDPLFTRIASATFWGLYRRWIEPQIPEGGVDIFGCTRQVRDQLLALQENHSSLIGLLFWVGFRRALVPYERREREIGRSAWTLQKRIHYMADSIYAFSDLPIKVLTWVGSLGLLVSISLSLVILLVKAFGDFPVPGYAATVLIVTFFGALNCFGLGIIGNYVWRTFENTKVRPNYIVSTRSVFEPRAELTARAASEEGAFRDEPVLPTSAGAGRD
jgi:glycosyltransferase involved in cell wall biosynthesis